ncbi:MAG: YncE family protein [Elusimicrobia bacterium]|nr:YncE family protein [Elusimicrobiota bacterium]
MRLERRAAWAGGIVAILSACLSHAESAPPSRFGKLAGARWAQGSNYRRANLAPVGNPYPNPQPHPKRERPHNLAVSRDGSKVYIGLLGSELEPGSEVAVYDVTAQKIVKRIPLKPADEPGPPGLGPWDLALHPEGRFLVVTNRFSNFASVIDTRLDAVIGEIPLDFYCQGAVFDKTGKKLYVANRYLDQVFVVDVHVQGPSFRAAMRELGGFDDKAFFGRGDGRPGIHELLVRRCAACHSNGQGGYYAGPKRRESLHSALEHSTPGKSRASLLLRAVTRGRDGGYADRSPRYRSHDGVVVFPDPGSDPDYRAIAQWIDSAADGPGISVGNPGSQPKTLALSGDGRLLFSGNTGTQDISVIDTGLAREVGAIYVQNAVDSLAVYSSPRTKRDYLIVATEGIGFGVPKQRDPFGGETWDAEHPAAQFSVWRDTGSGEILPRGRQAVLGPFDAVDETAEMGFRDMQNDIVFIDLGSLNIPRSDSSSAGTPAYLLSANRYEAHRSWVRYTSDTAESTYGDVKGDIPPDLMRVVGAMPERMAVADDRLFVSMRASHEVQEWTIDPTAVEPSDYLRPTAVYRAGLEPVGIAAGPEGTPAAGKVFVVIHFGGTLAVIDRRSRRTREFVIDPSIQARPIPDTDAERGELFVHSSVFSSDGDVSCFHCHRGDTNDGRPWGTHQVLGQEYMSRRGNKSRKFVAGTMGVPQLRGLFAIQPLYYEGTFTAFEQPREAMVEQTFLEDFRAATPQGNFGDVYAHAILPRSGDLPLSGDPSEAERSDLEERRNEFFRRQSLRYFGKAFTLRDLQRFIGQWQINEPRLLPNPFDPRVASVARGKKIYADPQVGCVSCHPPPHFAKKDLPDNPEQAFAPTVLLTARDGSSTLIGMNRLDAIQGVSRDLEPGDAGRVERVQGHFTSFQLRGLWDRPPVFLHNGLARTLAEVVATPGHAGLGEFKYEPLLGGVGERPGRREIGLNATAFYSKMSPALDALRSSGARIGLDTHGGTSQLSARQLQDLVDFLMSIE